MPYKSFAKSGLVKSLGDELLKMSSCLTHYSGGFSCVEIFAVSSILFLARVLTILISFSHNPGMGNYQPSPVETTTV